MLRESFGCADKEEKEPPQLATAKDCLTSSTSAREIRESVVTSTSIASCIKLFVKYALKKLLNVKRLSSRRHLVNLARTTIYLKCKG